MALSTLENKIANRVGIGSLLAGTGAIGMAFAAGHSQTFLVASTSAYAIGGASYIARHLYDHAGQKISVWQTLRASAKSVSVSTAQEVEQLAVRLRTLEHAIDNRIDVVSDSSTKNGKVAMGAWVHAAKQVLEKATLFDVAASPVDKDPLKLTSNWPRMARQMAGRVESYQRMLRTEQAQPPSDIIYNFDYPTS